MSDFFSEGKLGMLEAFNKYDYTCGVKFDSFAVYEVRRHMDMIVNNSDVVRVPVRRRKKVLAARKKGEAVDSVPYDLLADNAVSEPASLARSVITGSTDHSPLVLSEVLKSDGESTEALNEADTRSRVLNDAMEDYLTPEESNLLRRMYGLDGYEDTVGEISAERHVSKEIIRRIKNRALSKLRGVQSVAELRNALGS
jgi:RNA polymerase primary sigma factor